MADLCDGCGLTEPVVGLGEPPAWLCLDCFDAALLEKMGTLKAAMQGTPSKPFPPEWEQALSDWADDPLA